MDVLDGLTADMLLRILEHVFFNAINLDKEHLESIVKDWFDE